MSTESGDARTARVVAAGRRLDLEVVPTRFPDGTRTAAQAAKAIGVTDARVVTVRARG